MFLAKCCGWMETLLWVGWRLLGENGLNVQHFGTCTEAITADQSRCLFKAAALSAGDFHSSSALETAASVKHIGMEEAIPGAPPC